MRYPLPCGARPRVGRWALLLLATFQACATCTSFAETSVSPDASGIEFFETKIRPLFAARCYSCHGPEKQENGLRLDKRAHFFKGGVSGAAVKLNGETAAGPLSDHLLWQAVSRSEAISMPPDEALPENEILTLKTWLEMGAPWPADTDADTVAPTENLLDRARRELWSMQPVERRPLPAASGSKWPSNRTDVWIEDKLSKSGTTPSPQASKEVLVRRLSIDLLGLPATYKEIQAFKDDARPDAYVRRVDRALASPRYGERWGRHWLDVARYADTRGYEFEGRDRRYPYSFTYREYVYTSFNEDLPYNQFVLEQLAADLLPNPRKPSAIAGLGFLTIGRRYIHPDDTLDDRIDVVCRGLMGLTVTCARCHDHKFDPIPQQDYYSLYGVFASCEEPEKPPLIGEPEPGAEYEKFKAEHAEKQRAYENFRKEQHQALRAQFLTQVGDYLLASVADETTDTGVALASCLSFSKDELRPGYTESWKRFLTNRDADDPVWGLWKKGVEAAKASQGRIDQHEAFQKAVASGELDSGKPVDEALLTRVRERSPGKLDELAVVIRDWVVDTKKEWDADETAKQQAIAAHHRLALILYEKRSPLNLDDDQLDRNLQRDIRNKLENLRREIDVVETQSNAAPPRAMVLQDKASPFEPVVFIRGNPQRHGDKVPRRAPAMAAPEKREDFTQGSGRLQLAQTIVDPSNTFTTRILANRIWQHHFTTGFTPGPMEVGMRGDPPSHPELLDHLAKLVMEEGWSVKRLHREILLSSTYQQSSAHRADAAAVDPENRLWWRQKKRRLELEALRDSLLFASGRLDLQFGGRAEHLWKNPLSSRRAAYGFIDRQDLPNAFRALDFASPDVSTAARPNTTTPQQALLLMNGDICAQQAEHLAQGAAAIPFADQQIVSLFRETLARDPNSKELEEAAQFLAAEASDQPNTAPVERLQLLAQALLMTNEFAFVD